MKDFKIDDDWIMERISKQSNSFSQWMNGLLKGIQKTLESVPEDGLDNQKLQKDLSLAKKEISTAEVDYAKAMKEIENLGFFGKKISKFGRKIINQIQEPIDKEIKESLRSVEGLDFDLGFLTGKQKDLSSALYDVSKERGIESEGLLYLIKALPDLEAFLYSTSVKKYYRDHT